MSVKDVEKARELEKKIYSEEYDFNFNWNIVSNDAKQLFLLTNDNLNIVDQKTFNLMKILISIIIFNIIIFLWKSNYYCVPSLIFSTAGFLLASYAYRFSRVSAIISTEKLISIAEKSKEENEYHRLYSSTINRGRVFNQTTAEDKIKFAKIAEFCLLFAVISLFLLLL